MKLKGFEPPDHLLMIPHQHQPTNQALFKKMYTFYVYMYICIYVHY